MQTEMVEYSRTETSNEPQRVGQYFSLPALKSEILQEIPVAWIDRLFERLFAWYGNLIADRWGENTNNAKEIWRDDLSGLTLKQLKTGMELCRDSCKFPPTLPEFRALCLGSGAKIDAEEQWKICLSRNYTCAAQYWAVQKFGYPEFHALSWDRARFKFPAIIRDMMIAERDGTLPPIPAHVAERLSRSGA